MKAEKPTGYTSSTMESEEKAYTGALRNPQKPVGPVCKSCFFRLSFQTHFIKSCNKGLYLRPVRNSSIARVKNTFGAQHRILLTEQGFSQYMGTNIQAASLAYSYYAAKYDSMVDCFIINQANEGGKLNFSIGSPKVFFT